jgi:Cu(I)/Ag(I) efflux system membrane protein CusA/SilA
VVVEQVHKKLEEWEGSGRQGDYRGAILVAIKEVGGTSFFALLVMAVSFLPVLTLEAQEGRMFKPLAYTKTLAMIIAAVLAITLDPALRLLFTRAREFDFRPRWLCRPANALTVGRVRAESRHPLSRFLIRVYQPVAAWSLRHKWAPFAAAFLLVCSAVPVFNKLGSEFMPPLDEGSLLYMPSTMPGVSIGQAQSALQVTDRIIRRFPEVDRVFGKAGRADTPTDPAPLSMIETIITLRPRSEWPRVPTWYSSWAPEWLRPALRHVTPDHISQEELVAQLDQALKVPGLANAWTMPVKGRIDMLTTGVRTPVGLKISGDDLSQIEAIGARVEGLLGSVAGARSVFSERAGHGYFLDVEWDREALARYGLSVEEVGAAVVNAIGGENIATTVEGRARYSVNVRYLRDFRSDMSALGRVLVPAPNGQRQIPLGELARIKTASGPAMIRDENGLLTGYVYVDLEGRDPAGYIAEANRLIGRQPRLLPPGYSLSWSGQYEAMERVRERLKVALPLTLFLIIFLLYANTRSLTKTFIVLLAAPFSAVGAVWFLYLAGYNLSVGVWVGLIALLGVDAETGVFMLLYLDLAYEQARKAGRLNSLAELRDAILAGAVKRIRPKAMTVAATTIGLFPVMWGSGVGSDTMKRIAAPMIGGIGVSFLIELVVYPAIYEIWKWNFDLRPKLNLKH